MSSTTPRLGGLAVQSPTLKPQIDRFANCVLSAEGTRTSANVDLLKEYRRLDDTITMRLNRANASMQDKERHSWPLLGKGTVQDQACLFLWQELMANWARRTQLVQYCVDVVDQAVQDKKSVVEDPSSTPTSQRKAQAEIYMDSVKRDQIHRELKVENIVRQRAVDAFRSRCKYFNPPASDEEGCKLWNSR